MSETADQKSYMLPGRPGINRMYYHYAESPWEQVRPGGAQGIKTLYCRDHCGHGRLYDLKEHAVAAV